MLEVPTDSEGMDVDALADLVAREPSAPKMIYTIPTFQNPSGTTLTFERRKRLLELASTWGSMILEDDPYEMLRFAGTPLPSLRQLADESVQVVGVHTFSKILAPGLRVGWVSADPVVIEAMTKARQAMDTCTNTLQQRLIARVLGDGRMRLHLEDLREQYSLRKEAMQAALSEELAGLHTSWTDPGGGFFLWLTLPEGLDSGVLFPIALEEGVAYIPGEAFSVSGLFSNAVRLAFSAEQPERARLGVRKLRRAIDRYYMA
jgi:2-aminoadipate transaminase